MSGLVIVTDVPESMATKHDISYPAVGVQAVIALECRRRGGGGDSGGASAFLAPSPTRLSDPGQHISMQSFWRYSCQKSLLIWPTHPHCQHTGLPVLMHSVPGNRGPKSTPVLAMRSLAGGPAAAFSPYSIETWMRASSSVFFPHTRREN
jgi:hypothetical protein